ncbi:MAG: hypothetical protein ACYDD1_22775 [Caulobacteraceae bacterium]
MQRKGIDLENETRGILKVFGVNLPMRLSRGVFDDTVRDTKESDPVLSYALLPMLQARLVLLDTFLELDRRVKRKAREDALCRRFMGVPGVGEITALSFKAAVDDPMRCQSSRTAKHRLAQRSTPSASCACRRYSCGGSPDDGGYSP